VKKKAFIPASIFHPADSIQKIRQRFSQSGWQKNKRFETARFSLFILPAAGMGSPDIGKSGVKNPEKLLYREFRLV